MLCRQARVAVLASLALSACLYDEKTLAPGAGDPCADPAASYRQCVRASRPVLYLSFDDDADTMRACDDADPSICLELAGGMATGVEGLVVADGAAQGRARSFTDGKGYCTTNVTPVTTLLAKTLSGLNSWTVEYWLEQPADPVGWPFFVYDPTVSTLTGPDVKVSAQQDVFFAQRLAPPSTGPSERSATLPGIHAKPVHSVIRFDGMALSSFVNGKSGDPSASGPLTPISWESPLASFGGAGGNGIFTGTFDEPALYDRALTDAEVLAHCRKGGACTP